MNRTPAGRFCGFSLLACATVLGLCLSLVGAHAQDTAAVTLTEISSDPFTVGPGQHATEVEPHVLANGATEVAAFQTALPQAAPPPLDGPLPLTAAAPGHTDFSPA